MHQHSQVSICDAQKLIFSIFLLVLDEFHSATTDGKLYYRMPSVTALTGETVTMTQLKPFW